MTFFYRYKWHFLFWAIYFVFWTWLSIHSYHAPFVLALLTTISWAIGQGALNYFCFYRLFPRYFNTRRYGVFSLILGVGLALSVLFIMGFQILVFSLAHEQMSYSIGAGFAYVLSGNFWTLLIVIAIKSIRDRVLNDRRTQLLEKEKIEHELRFLRSQMNPHFLFNAINSIYVLIRKDAELASNTLLKFADLLRYQLYECNADRMSIEKEIFYLDNYIALEKLRRGNTLCTNYLVGEEVRHFSIAPLLIIPFVENAFKYVSSYPDRPNEVAVKLNCREGIFELTVENTVDEDDYIPVEMAGVYGGRGGVEAGGGASGGVVRGGIGLENVRRRLELIYNGRHQLDVRRGAKYFSVVLKIPVQ
jgi:two-component system, LytTR family, sensor kinase